MPSRRLGTSDCVTLTDQADPIHAPPALPVPIVPIVPKSGLPDVTADGITQKSRPAADTRWHGGSRNGQRLGWSSRWLVCTRMDGLGSERAGRLNHQKVTQSRVTWLGARVNSAGPTKGLPGASN